MKKKMKKLLALLMAVAMVLSLSVTAFANEEENEDPNPRTVTELEEDGSIHGDSTSEGPDPDDPVEVIFPTIPVHPDEDSTVNVFDIFLDPHGLIEETNAARYNTNDSVANKFDKGKRLFFLNSVEDEGATRNYKNESWPLTITNRGRQPINVDLTVDFTYDKNNFELVNDEKFVEPTNEVDEETGRYKPNANGKLDFPTGAPNNAAMYLALQIGNGTKQAITDPNVLPAADAEGYNAALAAQYQPTFQVKGNGNYLAPIPASGTGDDAVPAQDAVVFSWTTTDDAVKKEGLKAVAALTCTLSYGVVETVSDEEETTTVDETVKTPIITVAATIGAVENVDTTYTAEVEGPETAGILLTGDELTVAKEDTQATVTVDENTVAFKKAGAATVTIKADDAEIATVTLNVKEPDKRAMKASTVAKTMTVGEETYDIPAKNTDERVTFRAPVVGTILHTAINGNIDAYKKQWYDPANPPTNADGETMEGIPQGMTTAGYFWKLDETKTQFPTLNFSLTGNINDDNLWDAMDINPGISFDLIWDVFQRNDTNNTVDFGDSAAPTPEGTPPTISYNKTTSSSKTLTITWTKGSGDYEDFVPSTTVTATGGATLTMTTATTTTGGTLKNTNANALLTAGDKITVTFTDPNGLFKEVRVEGTTAAK